MAYSQEIILPPIPGPENDQTLFGVDSNKNQVRDDVEIFIWKNLSKDANTYNAYLKFAETECEKLKYVNDLKKLEFFNAQESRDLSCLSHYEKENKISENSQALYDKVYNTKVRKEAIKEISRKYNLYAKPMKTHTREERAKLCRFLK